MRERSSPSSSDPGSPPARRSCSTTPPIAYVAVEFFLTGRREQFEKPSGVFYHYCGKHLGIFFDYFSILFVFLSFTVMISGAGAVFEEYYGLSKFIGGIGLAAAVGLTVWF